MNDHLHPLFQQILRPVSPPTAFDEGAQAFFDGYADDANPYQAGTALHEEWEHGWDHEYNLHYREVVSDERDRKMLQRRT